MRNLIMAAVFKVCVCKRDESICGASTRWRAGRTERWRFYLTKCDRERDSMTSLALTHSLCLAIQVFMPFLIDIPQHIPGIIRDTRL